MRKLGRQGQAKSLARINERIDQHGVLEPGNDMQCRPRIISTTKKDHGCEQHSKDEANLLWGRDCAHEHTKGSEQPTAEKGNRDQLRHVNDAQAEMRVHHEPGKRQHNDARDNCLYDADDYFFDADANNPDRRQQTIFDLFAPSKIDHQRQRDRLHA